MRLIPSFSRNNLYQTRYTRLFYLLIFILIASPFLTGTVGSTLISVVFLSAILLMVSTFNLEKVVFWIYVALADLAFGCKLMTVFGVFSEANEFFTLFSLGIYSIFISLAILLIGNRIFWSKRVNRDTITGGICIYLLLGAFGSLLYQIIFTFDPQSFSGNIETLQAGANFSHFLYFSFTTLTTLGYGDIVPHNQFAMVIANLEAIVGQMYPAIFIARLVSLYTTEEIRD